MLACQIRKSCNVASGLPPPGVATCLSTFCHVFVALFQTVTPKGDDWTIMCEHRALWPLIET